jgi:hypothetical protein
MRNGFLITLAAAAFSIAPAFACDMHGESGIVEKNDLWISTDHKSINSMDEDRFNAVIAQVEDVYKPIIAARGKQLKVVRNWTDGTVNAYAQQLGNVWQVSMFGGLARHDTITEDGFALVVCHEIGHHIGGAPKKSSWMGTTWASNEGQADYWGSMKCFRKYAENDDNLAIVAAMEVPEFATKKCQENFASAEEIAICQRGAMAGLSLGNLFNALRNSTTELKFDTPDPRVVATTDHNHPAAQCRLDTYFSGSVCDKDAYSDVSDTNANTSVCARSESYTDGVRPLCWYKPAR